MSSAAAVQARAWLATKKATAAASAIGTSAPVISVIGWAPARARTPAAAIIASAYWAALNITLVGATRSIASAITELVTYTSVAGHAPNRSRIATANAVETVTLASPWRRGTGIGSSSAATTNPDSITSKAGESTCHVHVDPHPASAATASAVTAAA